jgi:cell wall integrity and stress response component
MIPVLATRLVCIFLQGLLTLSDKCGNSTANFYSYIQIGQSLGVQSGSTMLSATSNIIVGGTSTSGASRSVATVTVNRGTTLVITSFVPNEPTITVSAESDGTASTTLPPSSTASASQPNSSTQSSQVTESTHKLPQSFWNSPGKVAGVFVSVGLVLLLLLLGLLWKCRKRYSSRDVEKPEESPQPMARQISGSQTVSRSTSLLQLLGRRERARGDEDMPTSSNRLARSPTDMVIPVVDQRLDPQSMMIRFDDNDSRTSFRDEEDYSRRVWRVTNASDSDSLRSSEVAERLDKA